MMTRRESIGTGAALLGAWIAACLSLAAEPAPTRVRLESTSLASAGYDSGRRSLEIEFQSGAIYRYRDVPATVFADLLKAESKGRYFAQQIRGKFTYERIRSGKR